MNLLYLQDETGSPGLVVGVSIDGKTVWAEGMSRNVDIQFRLYVNKVS